MEFENIRETLYDFRPIFNGTSEQPIDLDVSLPDYCPDISRILKCHAVPQITSRMVVGDRLTVEGSTMIRIFYADEEKDALRCCELNSAFSADFSLRTVPEQYVVFTDTKVDFMNCRAVTKRRVDIHCAFTITTQVWGADPREMLVEARGDGIQIKRTMIPVCAHVAAAQQPINLSEEFLPEPGHPAPETILYFAAHGMITDIKTIGDKLMIKGEVNVHVLYETDAVNGNTDSTDYIIPFSQVMDLEGIDETCDCNVKLELLSTQVQLNEVNENSQTAFEAEVRGMLCVTATRKKELSLVKDGYSTDYEAEVRKETYTLREATERLHRRVTAQSVLPGTAMSKVIDAWYEPRGIATTVKDQQLEITGRISVSLLLSDEEDKAFYQETLIDFTDRLEWTKTEAELDPQIRIEQLGYRANAAGQMEIRADVVLDSPVYLLHRVEAVTEITPDELRPKTKDTACAMTLYYAEAGESIWGIAQRYNTTEEVIRAENELSGDATTDYGMLFIPAM